MAEIICQNSRTFVVNWNYLAEFTHFCRELIIIDKIHALLSKILSFYISLKNLYEKSVKIIAQYKQVLLSSVFSMQKIFIIQQKWFLLTNEAVKCFLCVSMFQGCFRSIAGVFQKAFKGVFSFIFSKNVINKLTTMSKIPHFRRKF